MEHGGLLLILICMAVHMAAALNCYKCSHMSDVEISTKPTSQQVVDYIQSHTSPQDPECIKTVWSSDTSKPAPICPARIYMGRNIPPQCAGTDMSATLTFVTNMTGEMVNVTTSFRWRYRDCYFDVESPQLADGCHDMKDYDRFVKNSFLSILSVAVGVPHKDIDGNICVCQKDKCNLNLPGYSGSSSKMTTQVALVLVTLHSFIKSIL